MGQLRERQSIPEITKSLTIVWSKPYEGHQLCRIEFPLYDPATNQSLNFVIFLVKNSVRRSVHANIEKHRNQ